MPFDAFVQVFDASIWLSIAVILLFASFSIANINAPFSAVVHGNGFSMRLRIALRSFVRIFLKQGDPFPKQLLGRTALRLLASVMFLAGVLLCNAYKHDNVYKMVLGRKLLLHETVASLIESNFVVYSWTERVSYSYHPYLRKNSNETWNRYEIVVKQIPLQLSSFKGASVSTIVVQASIYYCLFVFPEISLLEYEWYLSNFSMPDLTKLYIMFKLPKEPLEELISSMLKMFDVPKYVYDIDTDELASRYRLTQVFLYFIGLADCALRFATVRSFVKKAQKSIGNERIWNSDLVA